MSWRAFWAMLSVGFLILVILATCNLLLSPPSY